MSGMFSNVKFDARFSADSAMMQRESCSGVMQCTYSNVPRISEVSFRTGYLQCPIGSFQKQQTINAALDR